MNFSSEVVTIDTSNNQAKDGFANLIRKILYNYYTQTHSLAPVWYRDERIWKNHV